MAFLQLLMMAYFKTKISEFVGFVILSVLIFPWYDVSFAVVKLNIC